MGKTSFDVKRGVLKIEWNYENGEIVKNDSVIQNPPSDPEPVADISSTDKNAIKNIKSLTGVSATGTNYRFSPIRPKLKKKKRQVQETPEIEPENPGIPKGPTVEELKND